MGKTTITCDMKVVKYLMFLFNLLFWLSGVALIIVGVTLRIKYGAYISFSDHKFATADVFIISVGVIVFVVSFFGCCGALKENYCLVSEMSKTELNFLFVSIP